MAKKFINTGFAEFLEDKVQTRIAEMPWMKDRTFSYAKNIEEVEEFIDKAIEASRCVVDLETTGLSTRLKTVDGKKVPVGKIVGFGLCYDSKFGFYIPINHREGAEFNLPEDLVFQEIKRLCLNCVTIYHNAKFDLSYMRNYGIELNNHSQFEDTLLLAYLQDSGRKNNQLKELSNTLIDQPMLKFNEIACEGHFDLVSPDIGYVYGGSDAVCTLDLYNYFIKLDIIKQQRMIYAIEKRVVFVVMDMEANLIKIDVPYFKNMKEKVENRIKEIKQEIYDLVGYEFNAASSQKLGAILFKELRYKYPEKKLTSSGQYSTDSKTLSKIADMYPIVKKIMEFRGLEKVLTTYINNILSNYDEDDCVKFSFKQTGTDTGRFSSPGGKGLKIDGLCGVNVQSTPKVPPEDNPDVDMREGFVAHEGFTMVAIDYANEEMRVATNISNENRWIESLEKKIDFHTATGAIISGKDPKDVTKAERKIGKTVNFLALYLGGPYTLAGNAKIPVAEAKKILATFFAGVPKLKKWIDRTIAIARKEKYVRTLFGRTRPLEKYYKSGDKGLAAHADRCAVNTKIQGCIRKEERCLTTEGYLPIGNIPHIKKSKPWQELKVWTGISWEDFEVLNRGEAQLAEIELKNGMKVNCDTRHEVLTVNDEGYEFKKFEELTEDTKICISRSRLLEFGSYPESQSFKGNVHNTQEFTVDSPETWDFISYFLGCIIGDGGMSIDEENKKYIINLGFGKEEKEYIYPVLKEKLNKLGINISEPIINKGSEGLSYNIDVNSVVMVKLFQKMGYKYHNAHDKRVPQQIMESPIEMRKSFLRGYFDTDGCKEEVNKFSFHTLNMDLLRDIQLLAWTLGCPSTIFACKDGSYMLNWMDNRLFAELIGISYKETKRRSNTCNMPLPDFLRESVLNTLGDCYVNNSKDRSYVCKIREGHNVSLPGVMTLLNDYGLDLPDIYYYSNLKKETVLNKREDTYTLSVYSPLHRFDSAGIISKNTCADVMKAMMSKLHSWLTQNNLHDDIKVLITMHDELVYEIRTEKLQLYVPEICKIMQFDEVIKGKLNWRIPLEVDVQYGPTWRVKNDFFEDFPELKARLKEPLIEFVPSRKKKQKKDKPSEEETDKKDDSHEKLSEVQPKEEIKEPEDQPKEELQENKSVEIENDFENTDLTSDNIEEDKQSEETDQCLIYTLKRLTPSVNRFLNQILSFLIEYDNEEKESKKKILKIRDIKGNSLLVSEFKVVPEIFLAFARYYGI